MKVAPKIVFLFKDFDGFGTAIADALRPNPNSPLRRHQESFELSLDRYGISDDKACGDLFHFVDNEGKYQVSMLLLEKYEPPILVCAVSEVLAQISGEVSSALPTLIVPLVGASSKLKWENKILSTDGGNVSLYSAQIGPQTDVAQAIAAITQKAPSSFQILYEPLACLVQVVRALNLPTSVLIGQRGRSRSDGASEEELEILLEMGEALASTTCLLFSREKITLNPATPSRERKEPWRALYG